MAGRGEFSPWTQYLCLVVFETLLPSSIVEKAPPWSNVLRESNILQCSVRLPLSLPDSRHPLRKHRKEPGENGTPCRCTDFLVALQSLSCIQLFATPWPEVHQASLSFIISLNLLKLMSIESVMLSNHLILCCPLSSCPQSFPASGSFPMSHFFPSGGQSIGASASVSVLPMNIPLGLTGLISLQPKGHSRVFSSITVQKHQFFSTQTSLRSNSLHDY